MKVVVEMYVSVDDDCDDPIEDVLSWLRHNLMGRYADSVTVVRATRGDRVVVDEAGERSQ